MINATQSKAIKKVLGKQYSRAIIRHLNKKQIYNAKNESFKPDSIQKIVSGTENLTVEREIFKLVAKVKKELAIDVQLRKEIIKK